MHEAFRCPTRDGVLDPTREFLAHALVICLDSLPKLVLVPLHNPPQVPRAFRWAAPFEVGPARFFAKTSHPNFHSIFNGILPPKCSQKLQTRLELGKLFLTNPHTVRMALTFFIVVHIRFITSYTIHFESPLHGFRHRIFPHIVHTLCQNIWRIFFGTPFRVCAQNVRQVKSVRFFIGNEHVFWVLSSLSQIMFLGGFREFA